MLVIMMKLYGALFPRIKISSSTSHSRKDSFCQEDIKWSLCRFFSFLSKCNLFDENPEPCSFLLQETRLSDVSAATMLAPHPTCTIVGCSAPAVGQHHPSRAVLPPGGAFFERRYIFTLIEMFSDLRIYCTGRQTLGHAIF